MPDRQSQAIALMGLPLFFLSTKNFGAQAKTEVRSLLARYRQHRHAMAAGIVHPIGRKPDNASWCGFQSHLESENSGYLLIFRERCNPESEQSIRLGWVRACGLELTDLLRHQSRHVECREDGAIPLVIASAPDFLFLRYEVV